METITFAELRTNQLSLMNELAQAFSDATPETWEELRDEVAKRWDMVEELKSVTYQ